jgi:hypothetical protein
MRGPLPALLLLGLLAAPSARGAETAALRVYARGEWTRMPLGDIAPDPVKTRIVIHHTAAFVSDASKRLTGGASWNASVKHARAARTFHKSIRGWKDIGYHYIIDWEGRILEGRPIDLLGAHVEKHNTGSIGIVLMGDFTRQRRTDRQIAGLRALLKKLMADYDIAPKDITGHYQMKYTICPGTYLNNAWDEAAEPIDPIQIKPRPRRAR